MIKKCEIRSPLYQPLLIDQGHVWHAWADPYPTYTCQIFPTVHEPKYGNFKIWGSALANTLCQPGSNLACYRGHTTSSTTPNFTLICVYIVIHNQAYLDNSETSAIFGQFWKFGGLLCQCPFTWRNSAHGSRRPNVHLCAKYCLGPYILSPVTLQWHKTPKFYIFNFGIPWWRHLMT